MMRLKLAFIILLSLIGRALSAHEMWIDPIEYHLSSGSVLEAELRVGQSFVGRKLIYNKSNFTRFEVFGAKRLNVEGRLGDRPALHVEGVRDGYWHIVYETKGDYVTYEEADRFPNFLEHKALDGVLDPHFARGYNLTGFTEKYRRFAKSLVRIGGGEFVPLELGLEHEIVLLDDPNSGAQILHAQLLENGKPRVGARLTIFEKHGDEVRERFYKADVQGIVAFPAARGREYMLDAVLMRELMPNDANNDAIWESLWANFTFSTSN